MVYHDPCLRACLMRLAAHSLLTNAQGLKVRNRETETAEKLLGLMKVCLFSLHIFSISSLT